MSSHVRRWFARHALLPSGQADDVTFVVADGRFHSITPNSSIAEAEVLPGVVLPGLANAHSHAFHRALRGRFHAAAGTFWTWRQGMYGVARRLEPDSYLALARATYAEMALAGITCVGEFHYVHHKPDGSPYADPNAMGEALRAAASEAGIRLTLLDTCYLAGGLSEEGHLPLSPQQRRFSDGSSEQWSKRVALMHEDDNTRIGAAIHSVRAVPREELRRVVETLPARPLHIHLSEQPAENEMCSAFYGMTPTSLLESEGVLGPETSVIHATHLTEGDISILGGAGVTACFCPTTERDLADGIGPAITLQSAGAALSLGSDQHSIIDMFEESRGLEMHERLATLQRGRFQHAQVLDAVTNHASLGWADAGSLSPGARADLVAVRLNSPRTAGTTPEEAWFSASAADVDTVIVDGRPVVKHGQHMLGDVGSMLEQAIAPLHR